MKIVIPPRINKYKFYILTSAGLLIWMLFFDGSDLKTQFDLWQKLRHVENEKEFYNEQLKQIKQEHLEVMGNEKAAEKFAREKYLMKKSGETVFVIVDENNKSIDETENQ